MQLRTQIWHKVTRVSVAMACFGCAEATSANVEPDDAMAGDAALTDRGFDESWEPLDTIVRVQNISEVMRSRHWDGPDGPRRGVRRRGTDRLLVLPTCSPVNCADVPAGEAVERETACPAAGIAPARIDVEPGEWDEDFVWDGTHEELTARNCYEDVQLARGDAMVVSVCYGAPEGLLDIAGFECIDHGFEYGQGVLIVELE